jgi:hypothetical protein
LFLDSLLVGPRSRLAPAFGDTIKPRPFMRKAFPHDLVWMIEIPLMMNLTHISDLFSMFLAPFFCHLNNS